MSPVVNDASPTTLAWSMLEVRGDDAATFLQGQLSQDLSTLSDAGGWTLVLAPDSVVISAGFVTAIDGGFDIALPRELTEATYARLRRFLLRAACTLTLRESDVGPFATTEEQIEAGWPGPAEFAGSLTPHTFGATFVATTISFTKGCFTGQELVGRLDARGSSVPWRLVRVAGPDASRIEEVLKSKGPDGPQGLTTWRTHDGRVVGLGIAHRTLLSETLEGDVSVTAVE
jgi:tRNA-modifying protein YgfZ